MGNTRGCMADATLADLHLALLDSLALLEDLDLLASVGGLKGVDGSVKT